jgi:hypothetical protein
MANGKRSPGNHSEEKATRTNGRSVLSMHNRVGRELFASVKTAPFRASVRHAENARIARYPKMARLHQRGI